MVSGSSPFKLHASKPVLPGVDASGTGLPQAISKQRTSGYTNTPWYFGMLAETSCTHEKGRNFCGETLRLGSFFILNFCGYSMDLTMEDENSPKFLTLGWMVNHWFTLFQFWLYNVYYIILYYYTIFGHLWTATGTHYALRFNMMKSDQQN